MSLGFGAAFPIKESLSEGFALFQKGENKIGPVFPGMFKCPVVRQVCGQTRLGGSSVRRVVVITLDQWGLVSLR